MNREQAPVRERQPIPLTIEHAPIITILARVRRENAARKAKAASAQPPSAA